MRRLLRLMPVLFAFMLAGLSLNCLAPAAHAQAVYVPNSYEKTDVLPAPNRLGMGGQQVAQNCFFPDAPYARVANEVSGTYRYALYVTAPCSQLQLAWASAYAQSPDLGEVAAGGPLTLKASVEYNGTSYPLYFSGRRSGVLDPGAILHTDPCSVSITAPGMVYVRIKVDAGLFYSQATGAGTTTTLTDATQTWAANAYAGMSLVTTGGTGGGQTLTISGNTRNTLTVAASSAAFDATTTYTVVPSVGNLWPVAQYAVTNSPYPDAFAAGQDKADGTGETGMSEISPFAGAGTFGPVAVTAIQANKNVPVVIAIGDSIARGAQDGLLPTVMQPGYILRACGNTVPYIQMARTYETGNTFAQDTRSGLRRQLMSLGNNAVVEYGTNDIAVAGLTAAQTEANLQKVWNSCAQVGLRVFAVPLLPRVTTTNRLLDLAGQTPMTGFASGGARDVVNAYERTIPAPLAGILDVSPLVEAPTDHSRWAATGALETLTVTAVSGQTLTVSGASANMTANAYQSQEVNYLLPSFVFTSPDGSNAYPVTANTAQSGGAATITTDYGIGTLHAGSVLTVYVMPTQDGIHPFLSTNGILAAGINPARFRAY